MYFKNLQMKNSLRYYVLISLLIMSWAAAAQTQEVKFNPITGTNGVSLGKINGMITDKHGFMWFSDQSNRCIVRFDGSHMTRFQNDPKNPNSLGGYYPECLAVDSSGNIWIGFYGMGLDKFDPVNGTFTHFRNKPNDTTSLSNDFVTSILFDHLGNIWVGTYGGLDLLDQKTSTFKHYNHDSGDPTSLSNNTVRALYEDKAGEIWVGTGFPWDSDNEGGLNRFNRSTGKFTRYMSDSKNPNSLIDNKVRAIFEDSRGTFWVGTRGDGLHTLDRKTGLFTRLTYNASKPEQLSRPPAKGVTDHITFITEDSDKKIWIGTLLNGVTRYDPASQQCIRYGTKEDKTGALKDGTSWWAHATPDGFIWLSTQNANLFKIDIYTTIIPSFGSNRFYAFNEEADSVMWYGTESGLVRKDFKNGSTQRIVHEPGNLNSLSNNVITEIVKDNQGDFWIGTRNGLNHYNLRTKKIIRYYLEANSNDLFANGIFSICEDSDSNIWVGNWNGGLYMLNRKSGKFTTYKNDPADISTLSNNSINDILEGETSELWIATNNNGGLNKMNRQTGKFKRYLPGLSIACIYKDAEGIIWVGSQSGLFSYDSKTDSFTSLAEENSGNNIVQVSSITGDNDDNLWISAEAGIYMLNQKRDHVIRYGRENGIPEANNFFYYGSSFRRQDGELNFGFDGGYVAFYPDKLKTIPGLNQLYLTGLWLDNREIKPDKTGPLQKSLYDAEEIRLNYDQNIFSISATFIDFRNTGDKRIYYKLENYDKDWRASGAEERIHYFKVPPGEYNFRIKSASSNTGEWKGKSIAVIISPPWWTTWQAYVLYSLLVMTSVYYVHQFQKSRVIRAERERARARELEQAKEIEKAYTELKATQTQLIHSEKMASLGELTAGIAHEIQNPLNFVNNFSEVNTELIDELEQEVNKGNFEEVKLLAKDIKENEQKINHHGKRAGDIVKGMLQHSRTSSGQKELTDINALADEYLRLAYHGLRAKDKSFNSTMKTDFDETIGNINIIPQDIGRVILNLITNAFYVVNERQKLLANSHELLAKYEPTVSVSTKKEGNKVLISVKDNGNGIPQKILDKIFQPFFTTKPTGQGTGLGLSLSYDIVKAHGGEIKVETKENEGTEFTIVLSV